MKLEILAIANEVFYSILVFHKRNKLSSKFLLRIKLDSVRSHTVSFCFFQLHICLCVCAIITSSGGKEQQSTSVPSALTEAAFFLHLFGTLLLLHRARPSVLAASSRVGIIDNIGSIKQSR